MKLARRNRRFTAWIAIFAILLAALAPGIARALSSPQQQVPPWTDICTVVGTQAVRDAAPLSGSRQHDGAGFKHCPFCLNHAGHFVLPTVHLTWSPAVAAGAEFIPFSFTPPFPRFIRVAAQPRAPPDNS